MISARDLFEIYPGDFVREGGVEEWDDFRDKIEATTSSFLLICTRGADYVEVELWMPSSEEWIRLRDSLEGFPTEDLKSRILLLL